MGKNVKQWARANPGEAHFMERVQTSAFGPKTKALAEKYVKYESFGNVGWGMFGEVPPIIEKGEGSYLFDADGKKYIDMLSSLSVSQFGHNIPEITQIIAEQSQKLIHHFDFPHPQRVKLSEKLCKLSGISGDNKVAFGVTGSDAIEVAIRAARYFTGKPYILTPHGDYHGFTYGTAALSGKGGLRQYFYPVTPTAAVEYFYFPHEYRKPDDEFPGFGMETIKTFERLLEGGENVMSSGVDSNNVAAVLVEPFQSSAGYYIPPRDYLKEIRRICNKFGFIMIIDEIQTGLGRSGKLWAYEHSDIEPDIICTSKALGGGLPISAAVGRAEYFSAWGPASHINTQAGNVLACAAANFILDKVSSKECLDKVNQTGAHLLAGLKALEDRHPIIGWIDNIGVYTGIELVKDRKTKEPVPAETAAFVRDEAVRQGLIFERGGIYASRISLIPALHMPREVIDEAMVIFDRVFTTTEEKYNIG